MIDYPDPHRQRDAHPSDILGPDAHEWEELHRETVPYQTTLRVLGAYLDERHACRVDIIELVDGFTLRYYRSPQDSELVTVHFLYADLLTLVDDLDRKQRRKPFSLGHKDAGKPGKYEDAFRALGSELDGVKSYSLLIDETDEGLLVTYQYLNPSKGFMVRKRMAFLGQQAVDQVVQDARARRTGHKSLMTMLLAL